MDTGDDRVAEVWNELSLRRNGAFATLADLKLILRRADHRTQHRTPAESKSSDPLASIARDRWPSTPRIQRNRFGRRWQNLT